MKYIAYKGTPYKKTVTVPDRKRFNGEVYELAEIFPNYGMHRGHKQALYTAKQNRRLGLRARVEAHSGFSTVYVRRHKG